LYKIAHSPCMPVWERNRSVRYWHMGGEGSFCPCGTHRHKTHPIDDRKRTSGTFRGAHPHR
jgi:hypothetical protein